MASLTLWKSPSVTQPLKSRTGAPASPGSPADVFLSAGVAFGRSTGILPVFPRSPLPFTVSTADPSSRANPNSNCGEISRGSFVLSNALATPRSRTRRAMAKAALNRFGFNQICRSTNLRSEYARPRFGRACIISARAASSSWPYSTPAGHTDSHARHPRQRSICVSNDLELTASLPSSTARIRLMRPRGPSFSSPVAT